VLDSSAAVVLLLCHGSSDMQSNRDGMHRICCCMQRSDGSASPQSDNQKELCISPLSQFFCSISKQSPDIIAVVQLQANITYEKAIPCMQHLTELHDRFRRRVVCRWVGCNQAQFLRNLESPAATALLP
jgi:hypothetical protein